MAVIIIIIRCIEDVLTTLTIIMCCIVGTLILQCVGFAEKRFVPKLCINNLLISPPQSLLYILPMALHGTGQH